VQDGKANLSLLEAQVATARRELDELTSAGTAQTRYYQAVAHAVRLPQSLANQGKVIALKYALEDLAGHREINHIKPTVKEFLAIDKRVTRYDTFHQPLASAPLRRNPVPNPCRQGEASTRARRGCSLPLKRVSQGLKLFPENAPILVTQRAASVSGVGRIFKRLEKAG